MDRGLQAVGQARLAAPERHRRPAQARRHDADVHRGRRRRPAVRHAVPADGRRPARRRRSRWRLGERAGGRRQRGCEGRGKADPGDKTMIDALTPALRTLERSRRPRGSAARRPAACGGGRRAGDEDHHPASGPQGPRQLPGRAQRRPPGSRRHLVLAAARHGRGAGGRGRDSRRRTPAATVTRRAARTPSRDRAGHRLSQRQARRGRGGAGRADGRRRPEASRSPPGWTSPAVRSAPTPCS